MIKYLDIIDYKNLLFLCKRNYKILRNSKIQNIFIKRIKCIDNTGRTETFTVVKKSNKLPSWYGTYYSYFKINQTVISDTKIASKEINKLLDHKDFIMHGTYKSIIEHGRTYIFVYRLGTIVRSSEF
jgi:hypothetical protein